MFGFPFPSHEMEDVQRGVSSCRGLRTSAGASEPCRRDPAHKFKNHFDLNCPPPDDDDSSIVVTALTAPTTTKNLASAQLDFCAKVIGKRRSRGLLLQEEFPLPSTPARGASTRTTELHKNPRRSGGSLRGLNLNLHPEIPVSLSRWLSPSQSTKQGGNDRSGDCNTLGSDVTCSLRVDAGPPEECIIPISENLTSSRMGDWNSRVSRRVKLRSQWAHDLFESH